MGPCRVSRTSTTIGSVDPRTWISSRWIVAVPGTVVLGGAAVLVQAFDVKVLDVTRHVGHAPCVVRCGSQQDARRERERDAAASYPGARR